LTKTTNQPISEAERKRDEVCIRIHLLPVGLGISTFTIIECNRVRSLVLPLCDFGRFVFLPAIILAILGCRGDAPRGMDLDLKDVGRIDIQNRQNKVVEIVDSSEIQDFLAQLRSLPSREEGNVNNEFYLTIYMGGKPGILSLKMGKDCIGPLIPDSEIATRWYFANDSLYNFITGKFRHGRVRMAK